MNFSVGRVVTCIRCHVSDKHHEYCVKIINRENIRYNKRDNARKAKGKRRLNAAQERDSYSRRECTMCLLSLSTAVGNARLYRTNASCFLETRQES